MDLEAERDADLRILDEMITRIRNQIASCSLDDEDAGKAQDRLLKYMQRRAAMLGLDRKGSSNTPDGSIASATKRLELVAKK